jgi:uncharacterized protein (TIGR03905 family)
MAFSFLLSVLSIYKHSALDMKSKADIKRYIYHTRGVCPPEIHFKINQNRIRDIRFVGGGCPGNAQLAARLLNGKPIDEVLDYLSGIDCRNGTSCPDQLLSAIQAAKNSDINPAESFRLYNDPFPRQRIGLLGAVEGSLSLLEQLIQSMQKTHIETFYSCGNLTGNSLQNKDVIRTIRKQKILAIQGKNDWLYAQGKEDPDMPPLGQKDRDWLLRLPQVLSFTMDDRTGVAFFGDFVQKFRDFSDFEPFALEMNMVCGLTGFMQDESVFPALETMASQFQADIIIFSQIKKWGHWQIGGKDFISVGPALENKRLSWGSLQTQGLEIEFKTMEKAI